MAVTRRWLKRMPLLLAGLAVTVLLIAWPLAAYPRGKVAAWADGMRGHYEVRWYGMPNPWDGEYARLLHDRYGIRARSIGGCTLGEGAAR